jgi:hypothetical protein
MQILAIQCHRVRTHTHTHYLTPMIEHLIKTAWLAYPEIHEVTMGVSLGTSPPTQIIISHRCAINHGGLVTSQRT